MEGAAVFMELFTNVDLFLSHMHETYGLWMYVVLGLIFFLESGVFFTGPFLPGDSLLFVAGATAAAGVLDPWAVILGSTVGALFGNIVGFLFGAWIGKRLFTHESSKWFNQENLQKAKLFFDKHGGNAVALARFIPLIRSLIPVVAGSSKMNFMLFNIYSALSALAWTCISTALGYWLGSIPFIKDNLSWLVVGSILIVIVGILGSAVYKKSKEK